MTGHFLWNGEPIPFAPGETVALALRRAGVLDLGGTAHLFCGIGQCQGCLVRVDQRGLTEACLQPCIDGLEVFPAQPDVGGRNG